MLLALICGLVSVLLIKTGFLLFFLAPVAFAAYRFERIEAWKTALCAVLWNVLASVMLYRILRSGAGALVWDGLFFTVSALAFAWIAAPLERPGFPRIRTCYRFIAAAVLCTGFFAVLLSVPSEAEGIAAALRAQADAVRSLYIEAAGADVVERSVLEQTLTADALAGMMVTVAARGGGVVSCLIFLYINYRIGLLVARLTGKKSAAAPLSAFHADKGLVWVLSAALALLILVSRLRFGPGETALWNIVAVCCTLYLVQGTGIVLHFLGRGTVPFFVKPLAAALLVLGLCTPGLNAVILGCAVLLGIAENWAPLRAQKEKTPRPTPDA